MRNDLWCPSEESIACTNMEAFRLYVNKEHHRKIADVLQLQRWSVENLESFWRDLWNFAEFQPPLGREETILDFQDKDSSMPSACFFPNRSLNAAKITLDRAGDLSEAIVFYGENGWVRRISGKELREKVIRISRKLTALGIMPGDRVAAFMPNCPETIMAYLATVAIGAIWSSCSPDFGTQATLDRFGQIGPRILFATDGYHYGGKAHSTVDKVKQISAALPSLEHVITTEYLNGQPDFDIPDESAADEDFIFEEFPFNHPIVIAYSSGTTGAPKCIVHRAGGITLNFVKEHRLHCNIMPGDRVFYFTTCGWMMWNWLVGTLASGATTVLFDGAPLPKENPGLLWEIAKKEKLTFFGTSARYIQALMNAGYSVARVDSPGLPELPQLRCMASTGSPLSPEAFEYVYRNIKSNLHLASITGGTDLLGCFMLGSPTLPVRKGQIQMAGLGMNVAILDAKGLPCEDRQGELTCCSPFPNQPLGFWRDDDGSRYREAYFEFYPGVWYHGDFVTKVRDQGYIMHGRSDSTLNPGGVRIGSAEITRQVDLVEGILESVVVEQEYSDEKYSDKKSQRRVVLFVVLAENLQLTPEIRSAIKIRLRTQVSPRHVPAIIAQVHDIPRTRSGKISEIAIKNAINQIEITNEASLANPKALDEYRNHPEIRMKSIST